MFHFQYNIECSGTGGTPEPNITAAVGKALDQSQDKNLEMLQSSTLQNPDTGVNTYSKVNLLLVETPTKQL